MIQKTKINYIFVPPKKVEINKIPGDAGHFIRTEIDSTDFKKENLATKTLGNHIKKCQIQTIKTKMKQYKF